MNKFLITLCALLIGFTVQAQLDQTAFEKKVYQSGNQQLNYRILYPENFSKEQSYPVVLFLHGSGERGDDNEAQLVHGSKLFLSEQFRKEFPAIVIFPQCSRDSYWADVDVDRASYPLRFDFKNDPEPSVALGLVMQLMDSIKALPFTKDNQIYVGGLSMGGMGTFEIVSRKPEMFAAAFPICGGSNPDRAKSIAGKVPLWVFHGGKDDVVLPSYSTEMVIAIRQASGIVKYTLYPNDNHNSWDSTFAEPGLMPWLFSQRK